MVEFETLVLPHITPLMPLTDPIQILSIFMNNMHLLMDKTPEEQRQQHILPMIYNAIDSAEASVSCGLDTRIASVRIPVCLKRRVFPQAGCG